MTEAEFRALLAIEGRELKIAVTYFRAWDLSDRDYVRHVSARVIEKHPEEPMIDVVIVTTNWVRRRYYAVQSLIKRYYGGDKRK